MTDETYSCWMAFGALAAAGALWAQFMRARSMKRLLRLFKEQAALRERAVEQVELAKQLLTEAVDAGDNREKRTKIGDAQRALAAAGMEDDVRALAALLEPHDMVTDAVLRDALDRVDAIAARLRQNLPSATP